MPNTVRRAIGCLLIATAPLSAIQFRRRLPHFHHQAQSIGTRNRIHVNRLITETGTLEMEAGAGFAESGDITNPVLLKYTPAGRSLLAGRTEYSVGLDYGQGATDVTVAANSLLYDGEHWNVSLGPSLTLVRQYGDGLRAGATFVTRYDRGLASLGVTAAWSKATRPGANTPADLAAFGAGGGIRLASSGWRSHFTLNGNVLSEHASSTPSISSTFEGVEWEISGKVSANFVVQQQDWRGANRDNIFFTGLTVNFGRLRLH